MGLKRKLACHSVAGGRRQLTASQRDGFKCNLVKCHNLCEKTRQAAEEPSQNWARNRPKSNRPSQRTVLTRPTGVGIPLLCTEKNRGMVAGIVYQNSLRLLGGDLGNSCLWRYEDIDLGVFRIWFSVHEWDPSITLLIDDLVRLVDRRRVGQKNLVFCLSVMHWARQQNRNEKTNKRGSEQQSIYLIVCPANLHTTQTQQWQRNSYRKWTQDWRTSVINSPRTDSNILGKRECIMAGMEYQKHLAIREFL